MMLILASVVVTPTFRHMYEPFEMVLPIVSRLALSPVFSAGGGLLVLGLLVVAWLSREHPRRRGLLVSVGVLLGLLLSALYVFGLLVPVMPL